MASIKESNKQDLTLVLIGKTGNGKSATANLIFGDKLFEASDSTTSCTHLPDCKTVERDNRHIKIVDTPGFMDTNNKQAPINQLPLMMSMCPEGIDAMLLILTFGGKFTQEDKETIKMIKTSFGEDFIQKHVIIIMTHGDQFDIEKTGKKSTETFQDWCEKQQSPLKDLFIDCKFRVILFYNKGKQYAEKREKSVENVFKYISEIEEKYTNEQFAACYADMNRILEENNLLQLKLNIQTKISLLADEVSKFINVISDENNSTMSKLLWEESLEKGFQDLRAKADDLLREIEKESKGTAALGDLKKIVQDLKAEITTQENTTPSIMKLQWFKRLLLFGTPVIGQVAFAIATFVTSSWRSRMGVTKDQTKSTLKSITEKISPKNNTPPNNYKVDLFN